MLKLSKTYRFRRSKGKVIFYFFFNLRKFIRPNHSSRTLAVRPCKRSALLTPPTGQYGQSTRTSAVPVPIITVLAQAQCGEAKRRRHRHGDELPSVLQV